MTLPELFRALFEPKVHSAVLDASLEHQVVQALAAAMAARKAIREASETELLSSTLMGWKNAVHGK